MSSQDLASNKLHFSILQSILHIKVGQKGIRRLRIFCLLCQKEKKIADQIY